MFKLSKMLLLFGSFFFIQNNQLYAETFYHKELEQGSLLEQTYKNAFKNYGLLKDDGTMPINLFKAYNVFESRCANSFQPDDEAIYKCLDKKEVSPKDFEDSSITVNLAELSLFALMFRNKLKYGALSYVAHHEIGHYENCLNQKELQNILNCFEPKKTFYGKFRVKALDFINHYRRFSILPATILLCYFDTKNILGTLSSLFFIDRFLTSRPQRLTESYADKRASETMNCSQCCFEAAQVFGYEAIQPRWKRILKHSAGNTLSFIIRTLLQDGHAPDYYRGYQIYQTGLKLEQEGKLCQFHTQYSPEEQADIFRSLVKEECKPAVDYFSSENFKDFMTKFLTRSCA